MAAFKHIQPPQVRLYCQTAPHTHHSDTTTNSLLYSVGLQELKALFDKERKMTFGFGERGLTSEVLFGQIIIKLIWGFCVISGNRFLISSGYFYLILLCTPNVKYTPI
ncbi:hypothetical protein F7725_017542 [Dissostichus mawsoni]|uniref:Uncharacterized protein n=1 Tax=Dissostichus mawsoni TaxID=36200 RepID=A0A7J5Z6R9_DISMA|nr:hypothetical protein F7725_017542 [Dissostichus mawsoni]